MLSYLDRVLDDGADREKWLLSRRPAVGASDVAKLAKESSIESVLASKLSLAAFTGNRFTDSGNRWEPMMLAWAGIAENKALIHSPGEIGFAATPDGIGPSLAECKAKHMKVVTGPTLGEWRQLAWQFVCVPEYETTEFIWVELDEAGELRAALKGEPKHLTIRRDHPMIVKQTELVIPLATELLARLRVALSYERA